MPQSILILSGGLDSAVAAWMACEISRPVLALTFNYGQRSALREKEAAGKIAARLKVPHQILSLPWLAELTSTALVALDKSIPSPKEIELDDPSKARKTAEAVWVPNRNGIFLNVAAAYAETLKAEILVTGFNAEEGLTFPDNSALFLRAADEFFWYSTWKKIKVISPVIRMGKTEIARKAQELDVPLNDLWFCYEGGESPCRRCESCLRDFRALRKAGIAQGIV